MAAQDEVLTVKLLDKELKLRCPQEKIAELQKAAYYLDNKMREIRDNSKVISHEKIAQMAALNISYDLLALQKQNDLYIESMGARIRELAKRIEAFDDEVPQDDAKKS